MPARRPRSQDAPSPKALQEVCLAKTPPRTCLESAPPPPRRASPQGLAYTRRKGSIRQHRRDIPMRILKLLTLCVATGMGAAAVAADYTLTVSSWAPPTHGVNSKLWPTLIGMMEEATGGKVTAQIKYRLGPAAGADGPRPGRRGRPLLDLPRLPGRPVHGHEAHRASRLCRRRGGRVRRLLAGARGAPRRRRRAQGGQAHRPHDPRPGPPALREQGHLARPGGGDEAARAGRGRRRRRGRARRHRDPGAGPEGLRDPGVERRGRGGDAVRGAQGVQADGGGPERLRDAGRAVPRLVRGSS